MANPFFWIILSALILQFALETVANLLNLKALKLALPAALEGIYQPGEYGKSQEYTGTNTRFELVASAFRLLLFLGFWFSGGFNYLDGMVRAWGYSSIVSGLLYLGILFLGYELAMLPFSIYGTFVIEERFGFNRTTTALFVVDRLKGLVLAIGLGGPPLAGVLALFEFAGAYAWLYCWLVTTIFILTMQFIVPAWIMPLFNKFTPLSSGELKDAILKYARSVGFTIDRIFVMDGSRRSSKSNAFFTGFGREKRVALFDTLIEKHTVPELVAVLAHEIGHYKKKHLWQGIAISILHAGVVFFLLSIFLPSPGLYQAFKMDEPALYAGLVFFGLLYTPLELLLSIAIHMWSRKNEYEADRFAVETIEQPQGLIEALKKLYASSLSNLAPHPFYVFLNYSHPPLLQRVQAIQPYQAQRNRAKAT